MNATKLMSAVSLLIAFLMTAVPAHAQPPALGPASFSSDQQSIGQSVLTGIVQTLAANTVAATNTTLQNQGKSYRLELMPLQSWPAYRIATTYPDQPNQYYVKLPTIVGINVNIPILSDRQIYIPLDLNISCDGWQTGSGVVTVRSQAGPPSIEGGNIIEDILQIRDYVTAQVRSGVTLPAPVQQQLASKCRTIGASPSNGNPDPFAFIAWDAPIRRLPLPIVPRESIEVTFQQLRRLTARGNGAILYQPIENIILDSYVDFVHNQTPVLTMKEGDVVALNVPKAVITPPMFDWLVVIANIAQQPNGPTDTGWAAAARSASYSPGVHTLQITKGYVIPPSQFNRKPIFVTVPAYELTYTVKYTNGNVATQ